MVVVRKTLGNVWVSARESKRVALLFTPKNTGVQSFLLGYQLANTM